jgi:thymidine kinase
MLKLIVGAKGSGKTKNLINLVNEAVSNSNGCVVCVEKGIKLRYDVTSRCRLINVDEYFVFDARSLYGFIAGILASNHDVSDIFIDSALRICNEDLDAFERFVHDVDELADRHQINVVITASLPTEKLPEALGKFI